MKRFLYGFLAVLISSSVVWAAYNLRQRSDGGSEWVQNQRNDAPIKFSRQGDIENFALRVQHFDDFLGDLLRDEYSLDSGSDAQAADPVINASTGGTLRFTTGNVGGGTAATDATALSMELNWDATAGNLVLEARLRTDDIDSTVINVGFSDIKAASPMEVPFTYNGATLTSNASDAVAWVYDTAAATDQWICAGTASDDDASVISSGVTLVTNTYVTLRLEMNSSGNTECFIDGTSYGVVAAGITEIDLTPYIIITPATEADSDVMDLDYLFVGQDRS